MAAVQNMSDLFDPKLVKSLFNQVKGKSSVAALCAQTPVEFSGNKYFTFSMDNEVDLVGESQKRRHGGITVVPVKVVPHEIEYGARISEEFMEASEEEQVDILQAFTEGFSNKVARGLDIMAFHGVNPRDGQESALITMHFDKIDQTVDYNAALPDECVEDAIALIGDWDATGIAMAKTFASAMGKMRDNSGTKLYPGLSWGGNPKEVNGIRSSVNSTVSFGDSKDMAIIGDFANCFKWGYSKKIKVEIIPYGDPDNTGVDLKGSGQIYLRATTSIGFGILVEDAFARVVEEA
ncbi:MAG: phage major capsid protein [Oscillospiraceae bacterium]|nr:phage major capsid protein [Oscillospiraceae bacterium]